jgi:2-polyprenyl-6-methoxyphenol hydroxylase-like FAD-dependent oxidoreductase
MSTVVEIEQALQQLPLKDARAVADWLQEYLEARWDRQLEADAANGRLERLWQKARADIAAGKVKPLDEVLNDE